MSSKVEYDESGDPIVGVDLDDVEHLGAELVGRQVAVRGMDTSEGEAFPAGRDDARRYVLDPDLGGGSHVCDLRYRDRVGARRSRSDGDRH